MIELSLEPVRIVAGVPCPLVVRLRNTGPGLCSEIKVDLRTPGDLSVVRGPRTVVVGRLGAADTHDHELEVWCTAPGRHGLRVHRLEYIGPEGGLQRTSGELVVEAVPPPPPPPPPRRRTASAFLSYRRADSGAVVGRLAEMLGNAFPGRVFHDHAGLEGGDLFAPRLVREIASSAVVVALIGPTWLKAENAAGRRRLEIEDDFVRLEIVTAFEHGIDVVPVLLDGAEPLRREQLAGALQPLCDRHCLQTTSDRQGLERIVALLGRFLGP